MTMVGWTATHGIDPTDSELTIVPSETGVITGSGELVTNGTFDTDISSWDGSASTGAATVTWDVSSAIKLTAPSGTDVARARQTVTGLVVGEVYILSYNCVSIGSGGTVRLLDFVVPHVTPVTTDITSAGRGYIRFESQETQSDLQIYATNVIGDVLFDDISIRREDFTDYSSNNLGMYVNGSLTASSVATGAELQLMSGFANTSYVESTRGRFMPGTGDFFIRFQFKQPQTASAKYLFMNAYHPSSWSGSMFWCYFNSDGTIIVKLSDDALATSDSTITTSRYDDGLLHTCDIVKSGTTTKTVKIYIDSILVKTQTLTAALGSISNSLATMRIGAAHNSAFPNTDGYVGPISFGYSAPSAEQIAAWHEEESRLFKKYAPLQIVGQSYEMDVPHERIDPADSSDSDMSRSYGGNSQTIITDEYDEYNLSTSILEDLYANKFAAFLRSVYGETFTFDRYGTIAAPDEPITLEMISPRRPRDRVGTLARTYKFNYKARTV